MGRWRAFEGLVRRGVVNRQRAVSLGEQAKKMSPEKSLGPADWWSRRESNPRPQAFAGQFYMRSRLIWISPLAPRSGTLRKVPVT